MPLILSLIIPCFYIHEYLFCLLLSCICYRVPRCTISVFESTVEGVHRAMRDDDGSAEPWHRWACSVGWGGVGWWDRTASRELAVASSAADRERAIPSSPANGHQHSISSAPPSPSPTRPHSSTPPSFPPFCPSLYRPLTNTP